MRNNRRHIVIAIKKTTYVECLRNVAFLMAMKKAAKEMRPFVMHSYRLNKLSGAIRERFIQTSN